MLLDHYYAFGLKQKFVEEGDPPWPTLAPHWIRPWTDLAEKQQHL